MDPLPLARGANRQLCLDGVGPVTLVVDRTDVLRNRGQGELYRGKIFHDANGGSLIMEVAVKTQHSAHGARCGLQAEAAMHAHAWCRLDNVLRPLGFLAPHNATGSPAMLVLEIAVPFVSFVEQAGPLAYRRLDWAKALTRITFQLMRFIVKGCSILLMHKDIDVWNLYVVNAGDLDLAELAVGSFGAAQRGEQMVGGGGVFYSADLYKWDRTSPRLASFVYEEIVANSGISGGDVKVSQRLALYNDLFNFARIAVTTLMDCPPPDLLYGPSSADMASLLPPLGHDDVVDAHHHILIFAMNLLAVGRVEHKIDLEYINSLRWYSALSAVL